jgi:ribonucleotide reductase beta subunit family protein with ferritin-like domain
MPQTLYSTVEKFVFSILHMLISIDDEQTEYAMSEILRFITGLRVRMILSDEESKSLEELLFENG